MQHYVDELLRLAFSKRVSDIHIEPTAQRIQIRFRIDGILYKTKELMLDHAQALFARIKILAKLDIAEKRLPQDGHFKFEIDNDISFDCRVSTINTVLGEKIVIRLLPQQFHDDLYTLGMHPEQVDITLQQLKRSHGLILICGPTGSGKTKTLYTLLNYFNKQQKNICTIEDPVEVQLLGIQQTQTQNKIGLSFSAILRALLRQDPDIILIGELRDHETAELAIHAANTGHLVLATVHAPDTQNALLRLEHLGISPFDIKQSVQFMIAQRLIRTLCPYCKQAMQLNHEQQLWLQKFNPSYSQDFIYEAHACEHCLKGYCYRTGIFELSNHAISLKHHSVQKLLEGITSLEELTRVVDFEP